MVCALEMWVVSSHFRVTSRSTLSRHFESSESQERRITFLDVFGGAPKERRRRRAEKRLSKRVSLESPFLLCPLKVFRTFQVFLRENLKGAEKKRTLQEHPFGQPFLRTTPSPLLWRTLSFGGAQFLGDGLLKSKGCACAREAGEVFSRMHGLWSLSQGQNGPRNWRLHPWGDRSHRTTNT